MAATKTFQGSPKTEITAIKLGRYVRSQPAFKQLAPLIVTTAMCRARGRSQANMPSSVEADMPNGAAKADPDITVTDELDPIDAAVINDGLRAHNISEAGYLDFRPLAVFVRDRQTGKVVGGLHGRSEYGLVYVAWFFLPEDLRRARIGSRVLAIAEEEGRRRGCTRIALTTLSIEAPGFYLKQGYEVAATIDCDPPGLTRYYMMKKL
jgi:GNAT superfamily N-acetyltransferase